MRKPYRRWKLYKSWEERFWSRVNKDGPIPINKPELGPCWLWIGTIGRYGYGHFCHNGITKRAHTFIYRKMVGDIPKRLQLDHLCRNRECVNTSHLELVTSRENMIRGVGPTATNAKATHCVRGHEFTPANTYMRPTGGRACKMCARIRVAMYYNRGVRRPRVSKWSSLFELYKRPVRNQ